MQSVLILDDEQASIDVLSEILESKLGVRKVVGTRYPTQALQLAAKHCFDFVLIDVTLNYNGSPFGGLEVYAELVDRYGTSSLLAYSNYINDDLLKKYHFHFNFLEKEIDSQRWVTQLKTTLEALRSSQSCFVAMPFDGRYDRLFETIQNCVNRAGYRCVRLDQQVFTRSIVQKIFEEIRKAKLIIFVATDQNPNVYYEAGFSAALGKEVISLTDSYKKLPFDIRDHNAILCDPDLKELDVHLLRHLTRITDIG